MTDKDYNAQVDSEGYLKPPTESYTFSPEEIKTIQGESSDLYDWVDRGIVDVRVADLPDPEWVKGPSDFHHITWKDAQKVTADLPQLQKEVNAGKTAEDFSREDEIAGLDHQHGRRRLYDLYYGEDSIRVGTDGGEYTIDHGQHRIFAAKHAGLETIPVRLLEKIYRKNN
jgi:hypothetical protein